MFAEFSRAAPSRAARSRSRGFRGSRALGVAGRGAGSRYAAASSRDSGSVAPAARAAAGAGATSLFALALTAPAFSPRGGRDGGAALGGDDDARAVGAGERGAIACALRGRSLRGMLQFGGFGVRPGRIFVQRRLRRRTALAGASSCALGGRRPQPLTQLHALETCAVARALGPVAILLADRPITSTIRNSPRTTAPGSSAASAYSTLGAADFARPWPQRSQNLASSGAAWPHSGHVIIALEPWGN